MSQLLSPGFEPPNDAWALSGNATIVTSVKHSGLYSLRLVTAFGVNSVAVQTAVSVVIGRVTPIVVWTNGDTAGSVALRCAITDNGITYDYTLASPIGGGWQAWHMTDYIPNSTAIDVVFFSESTGSGSWYIDDIALLDQHYPPENGPYKVGQPWHVDDIMGTMMPLDAAYRDEDQRLVDSRLGVDELGRDEMLRHYDRPIEILRRDP